MFCIISFVVLAILGIFSAAYRQLAREALQCVLRRMTLRPCTTGFDEKMKAKILGTVINRSESAARLLNRNFELISWVFFLVMVTSTLYGARGLYLFYVTGSCSGANRGSFCVLDPNGSHNAISTASGTCPLKKPTLENISLKGIDLTGYPVRQGSGKGRIVMSGCYGCDYSREVYPRLKELADKTGAEFIFIDYPVKVQTDLMTRLGHCAYGRDCAAYWRLNDLLFSTSKANLDDPRFVVRAAGEMGLNEAEMQACVTARATAASVGTQLEKAVQTNFYGTPTVFINDKVFVGPKPYRVYAIALEGVFYWLK